MKKPDLKFTFASSKPPLFQNFYADTLPIINRVLQKYLSSGAFSAVDLEDVRQTIYEKLLKNETKICENYKGLAKFENYLSVIINNICIDLIRQRKSPYNQTLAEDIDFRETAPDPEAAMIIEQEQKRLGFILKMFNKQLPKIILCLKTKYRIPYSHQNFLDYNTRITAEEFEACNELMRRPEKLSDKVVFIRLSQVFNKYEGKGTSYKSLHKYTANKVNIILKLLNGDPPKTFHTEDTLHILLERMFSQPFSLNKQ